MKKKFLLYLFLLSSTVIAQNTWQYTYCGNNACFINASLTLDSGFIATGFFIDQFPNGQLLLAKTNQLGKLKWAITVDDTTLSVSHNNAGYMVKSTRDSGYICTGYSGSGIFLIKTDSIGDTLWTCVFKLLTLNGGYSVIETSDSGYLAVGYTQNSGQVGEMYIIKTSSLGDTIWTRHFGSSFFDMAQSVIETFDGNYIVAGVLGIGLNQGGLGVVKLTPAGDTLWSKIYSAPFNGKCIRQTSDGGFIIVGEVPGQGFNPDIGMLRIDSIGNILWAKNYGGINDDRVYSVSINNDGGFTLTGYTESFSSGRKVYIIRTDMLGDTIFTRTFYDSGTSEGHTGQQLADGSFIFSAQWDVIQQQHSYATLVKTDSMGIYDCEYWNGTSTIVSNLTCTPLFTAEDFGSTSTQIIQRQLKLNTARSFVSLCDVTSIPYEKEKTSLLVSPNPVHGILIIRDTEFPIQKVELINSIGDILYFTSIRSSAQDESVVIDCSSYTTGIYFVKVQTEKGSSVQMLIVQ